jgi:pimeloyl-ACP methyl ester carboxylesterase
MPGRAPLTDAILVHGSFSSDLVWQPVLAGLLAGGVTPHPLCLPGHGRRSAEAGPELDLHRHAQCVVDYVEEHDLREVMLVGHSYGGMPVTQAWDALRDRVAAVVYVDAGIAVDGQCQLDLLDPAMAVATRAIAAEHGGMLPPPVRDTPTQALAIAALDTPLRLRAPLPAEVPRTLVLATGNSGYHHRQAAERRGEPGWTIVEVESGHNVIAERPDELVQILLTQAAEAAPD